MLNLVALGAGAGLMYILDPDRGNRRRALIRDQLVRMRNELVNSADVVSRDLAHRTQGSLHHLRQRFEDKPVDNAVLEARVRAKLGRYVSHPHAVEVVADQGVVTLKGLVLSDEIEELFRAVENVPGVDRVVNEMEPHQRTENIPALQGGKQRTGEVIDLFQDNWAPATRFLVGLGSLLFGVFTLRTLSQIPKVQENLREESIAV